MTNIVFVCADIGGKLIDSHRLVIQPIFDLMKSQGYDCRWGRWIDPWGEVGGLDRNAVSCYVTGDTGIRLAENTAKTFFHPHGIHPREQGFIHNFWYSCLVAGEWWTWEKPSCIWDSKHNRMPEDKCVVTGWAKLDVLSKPNIREETITKYNLGGLSHNKTVLYAPTGNWDWASSFELSAMPIIRMFENLPYNLLVKTGVYSNSFKNWGEFSSYFRNAPNHIRLITEDYDLTPLYALADAVITDGSSVVWEAVGLDKPTIQLNNMPDPKSALVPAGGDCQYCPTANSRGNKYNTYLECRVCGGAIKCSLAELRDFAVKAVENPNEYADERRKWGKLVCSPVDGHATERCVEAIKRIARI